MDTIRTDAGLMTLQINDGPDTLSFDPNDMLFAERFYALIGRLGAKEAEFAERARAIDSHDSTDTTAEAVVFMREACEYFCAEIDILFGEGTSVKLFGGRMSLVAIGSFFEGITPYIGAARKAKLKRYTAPRANGRRRARA